MTKEPPQVNIRLSEKENEVLEAAAWAKQIGKTDLAKEILLEEIARYEKARSVQTAIKARKIEAEEGKSRVTPISSLRKKKPKSEEGDSASRN